MPDERFTADDLAKIHAIKRERWQSTNAAAEYQHALYEDSLAVRMKNRTELAFVLRNARGPLVLDAGAGTGRFSVPLREQGIATMAIDISKEMLGQGRQMAESRSVTFPCGVSEIERLPFADGTFDSVVSITVLRHFGHWQAIVAELVRVLKPGGRLIFDMASGDQRQYLLRHGLVEEADSEVFNALGYEAYGTLRDLEWLAATHGMRVAQFVPYEPFNENRLMEAVMGERWEALKQVLQPLATTEGGTALLDCVFGRFFPALGPTMFPSWIAVLEKEPSKAKAYAAAFRNAEEADLATTLQAALDRRYDSYLREYERLLENPDARKLAAIIQSEVLPEIPGDVLLWEAPER
jgi:ubiquinone/menaquinone biosynthesis C-methylase UbiE